MSDPVRAMRRAPVCDELLMRARNLERYPFESATMAEAAKMAARHLREAARDLHTELPESVHDSHSCTAAHEVFYIQLSDDGTAIRKWSRTPFEGCRMFRAALAVSPTEDQSPPQGGSN